MGAGQYTESASRGPASDTAVADALGEAQDLQVAGRVRDAIDRFTRANRTRCAAALKAYLVGLRHHAVTHWAGDAAVVL